MPAEFGPVEELIGRLRDPEEVVRLHAALVLGSLGEEARPAVPALLDLLTNGDVRGRRAAAWALRDLGPVAEDAVPALLEALDDPDDQVEELAVQALSAIEGVDDEEDDDLFRQAA